MERKYLEPLRGCFNTLKNANGINYIILVADSADKNNKEFIGGSGWNINEETDAPDFFSMVGGLIENYLSENDYSYIDKIKQINSFCENMLNSVTTITNEKLNEGE